MISERILVENNILYNQNEIVTELVKARVIINIWAITYL